MSTELNAVEYGKVDSISSKEIKISPAKTIVFRRYIDHLTTRIQNNKIWDFNPGRFHIYAFPIVPGISNARKWTWDKKSDTDIFYLSQYAGTDIGCLKSVTFLTVDKDSLASTETSYEKVFNIPLSGWLFSTQKKFDAYIKDDYNYTAYNYSPVMCKLLREDYNETVLAKNGFDFKYWGQNYDFSDSYMPEEYLAYNMSESTYPDSLTEVNSLPSDYEVKKLMTRTAAIVIAYHLDKMIVPVTYTELHTPFYTTHGIIRIEWSQNGIITVK